MTSTAKSPWRWWWLLPLAAWYAYSVVAIMRLEHRSSLQVEVARWLAVLVVIPLLAWLVALLFVPRMKCPHCGEKVGFFSVRQQRWAGDQTCPHCGAWVKSGVNRKALLLWAIPSAAFAVLAAPFIGMIAVPIALMFMAMRSLQLKH